MKSLFVALVLIFTTSCARGVPAAGKVNSNGSVGTGNAIKLEDSLFTLIPPALAYLDGNLLKDRKTREVLLSIEKAEKADLSKNLSFAKSKIGRARGYEYMPSMSDRSATNHWIVCTKHSKCYRLSPKSLTNPLVPQVIGSMYVD